MKKIFVGMILSAMLVSGANAATTPLSGSRVPTVRKTENFDHITIENKMKYPNRFPCAKHNRRNCAICKKEAAKGYFGQ